MSGEVERSDADSSYGSMGRPPRVIAHNVNDVNDISDVTGGDTSGHTGDIAQTGSNTDHVVLRKHKGPKVAPKPGTLTPTREPYHPADPQAPKRNSRLAQPHAKVSPRRPSQVIRASERVHDNEFLSLREEVVRRRKLLYRKELSAWFGGECTEPVALYIYCLSQKYCMLKG